MIDYLIRYIQPAFSGPLRLLIPSSRPNKKNAAAFMKESEPMLALSHHTLLIALPTHKSSIGNPSS
jgi:hypothetical protein